MHTVYSVYWHAELGTRNNYYDIQTPRFKAQKLLYVVWLGWTPLWLRVTNISRILACRESLNTRCRKKLSYAQLCLHAEELIGQFSNGHNIILSLLLL